jgi:hypothetical protein
MEIAIITIAFWLVLVALYSVWPVLRRAGDEPEDAATQVEMVRRRQADATPSFLPERPTLRHAALLASEPFLASRARLRSETDDLRVQRVQPDLRNDPRRPFEFVRKRSRFRRSEVSHPNVFRPIKRPVYISRCVPSR